MRARRTAATALLAAALLAGGLSTASSAAATAAQSSSAAALTAGSVVLLPPARIADSRSNFRLPTFAPKAMNDLQVVAVGGVPLTGVSGVILNVTAVDGQTGGFLAVYTSGTWPGTSNVNFVKTAAVANEVTVKTDDSVRIYNGSPGSVDVVVDVMGYITG